VQICCQFIIFLELEKLAVPVFGNTTSSNGCVVHDRSAS